MINRELIPLAALLCLLPGAASLVGAQPPPEPPPPWDTAGGGSFVGTSGNTETSTIGADFTMHRRWPVWQIEAAAVAISTTSSGRQAAERYLRRRSTIAWR